MIAAGLHRTEGPPFIALFVDPELRLRAINPDARADRHVPRTSPSVRPRSAQTACVTDQHAAPGGSAVSPDLRAFIDRVIVPALLDRFLREQAAARAGSKVLAADLPKVDATV